MNFFNEFATILLLMLLTFWILHALEGNGMKYIGSFFGTTGSPLGGNAAQGAVSGGGQDYGASSPQPTGAARKTFPT